MRCLLLASIVVLALGAAASAHSAWRNYPVPNRVSRDGMWWRGYGRMGYGWYSVYGGYVGSDYGTIGYGYGYRSSGFNFNRIDNYGSSDPRAIGDRAR